MIVLSTNNISKSYITTPILENITFNINERDKVGLIGVNGAGKTTLFNILAGDLTPDSGDIYTIKNIRLGYLKQNINLESEKTLYEECLQVFDDVMKMEKEIRELELQMAEQKSEEELEKILIRYQNLQDEFSERRGYSYDSEIKGTLRGLGFNDDDFDKIVNTFSGGQKSRIMLAKLMLERPNMLLLDEPTNHLDVGAIEFLESFLRDFNGAVIIISHDRYFLDAVTNKIFHLENRSLEIYNTNYTKYIDQRKKRLRDRIAAFENQQKEIKRQKEIIERFANYGNAKLVRKAKSRQKLLEKMEVLDSPTTEEGGFNLIFTPALESGKDVLRVKNLSKSFGDKKLFENVDFNIYKKEKVGLIGPNGVGKTTLFRMIMNKIKKDFGDIELGHQVKVGYFDQEQKNLNNDNTIIDEIWDEFPRLTHYEIRTYLAKFMFVGDDIFKSIEDLSGGEKARISLLKLMLSDTNFLLMDEPTNHLDIDSKEALEDALNNYDGTCLVISHDRYFLNKVVDKILVLEEDGVTEYLGNYDYYIEKLKEQVEEKIKLEEKSKTQINKEKKKEKEKIKENKKRKKEIKSLEEKIEKVEENLNILHNKTLDETIYEDKEKMFDLFSKIEELEKEKENLYDLWFELQD